MLLDTKGLQFIGTIANNLYLIGFLQPVNLSTAMLPANIMARL